MKTSKAKTAKRKPYRLFLCFDFPDDLYFTPYTRRSLEALFRLYQGWGVERIYWIYTLKHRERLWECVPCRALSRNYEITHRRLGEFLPVAVEIAHDLGMEFYAVYKPFDIAFDETFPFGTPQAKRFGRLDSLSGRVYWSAECLVRRQALRIQRRWDDVPADLARRRIGAIRLTAGTAACTRLNRRNLTIWVSRDNNRYRPYHGPMQWNERVEKGCRVISLDDLVIDAPYVALRTLSRNKGTGTFVNKLANLVAVYDADGRALPFTYGLYSREERYRLWKRAAEATGHGTLSPNLSTHGYIFNWHNAARRNFLNTTRYAVDNEKGFLALAKGKARYVTGALSPAYPQVRKLWLAHIRECLDAGVDGVDLRPSSHNRNLEWENYGFEPPVREAFVKCFGREPVTHQLRGGDDSRLSAVADCHSRGSGNPASVLNISGFPIRSGMTEKIPPLITDALCEPGGRAGDGFRCREILGGCYTEFVRAAGALIRARGKRVQIHLGRDEIVADAFPVRFEWERWVREGLADELTLITDYPSHYYKRIAAVVAERPVPMYFRKYIKAVTYRKRWQAILRRYLRQSHAFGQAGFIVYESAMVARGLPDGSFKVLYPDVPRILREFQKNRFYEVESKSKRRAKP